MAAEEAKETFEDKLLEALNLLPQMSNRDRQESVRLFSLTAQLYTLQQEHQLDTDAPHGPLAPHGADVDAPHGPLADVDVDLTTTNLQPPQLDAAAEEQTETDEVLLSSAHPPDEDARHGSHGSHGSHGGHGSHRGHGDPHFQELNMGLDLTMDSDCNDPDLLDSMILVENTQFSQLSDDDVHRMINRRDSTMTTVDSMDLDVDLNLVNCLSSSLHPQQLPEEESTLDDFAADFAADAVVVEMRHGFHHHHNGFPSPTSPVAGFHHHHHGFPSPTSPAAGFHDHEFNLESLSRDDDLQTPPAEADEDEHGDEAEEGKDETGGSEEERKEKGNERKIGSKEKNLTGKGKGEIKKFVRPIFVKRVTRKKRLRWDKDGNVIKDEDGDERDASGNAKEDGRDSNKEFVCHICDKEITSGSVNFKAHMRRHQQVPKPFPCPKCEAAYQTKQNLQRHEKSFHQNLKPHTCMYCAKTYAHENSLKIHLRIHNGEKPFICNECGKSFHQNESFKVHLKMHGDVRDYLCDFCGKGFLRYNHWKTHMMRHQDDKKFTCDDDNCEKSFVTNFDLERHKWVHKKDVPKSELPFKCSACDKTFNRSDSLKDHMNFHKGIRPHRCLLCSKTYADRSSLVKHKKLHELKKQKEQMSLSAQMQNVKSVGTSVMMTGAKATDILLEAAILSDIGAGARNGINGARNGLNGSRNGLNGARNGINGARNGKSPYDDSEGTRREEAASALACLQDEPHLIIGADGFSNTWSLLGTKDKTPYDDSATIVTWEDDEECEEGTAVAAAATTTTDTTTTTDAPQVGQDKQLLSKARTGGKGTASTTASTASRLKKDEEKTLFSGSEDVQPAGPIGEDKQATINESSAKFWDSEATICSDSLSKIDVEEKLSKIDVEERRRGGGGGEEERGRRSKHKKKRHKKVGTEKS